ncbi:MAG: alpha-L-fucosidase [Bacteroidales bacterium]|nr:alpha-L-fucosidase [Bacteroidales bacterium]MCF8402367.1 alpha-L-fucosidase [Bacteroidales bacterium]
MKKYLLVILCLFFIKGVLSQAYQPTWESLDKRPVPAWFEDAKFGIFIHWGVYSVPAYRPLEEGLYASYAEWYYARVYKNEKSGGKAFHDKNYGEDFEYRQFAPIFKAELWDPDQWAKLFKDSGAKYVVLTSKHHDGYCLWPTKSPYKKDWNSMEVGPKRDLVGELTEAVRKEGLKMGLYYSIVEWESSKTSRTQTGYHIPLDHVEKYKIPETEYVDKHLLPQLKELVNNYQPSLIFADGGEWDGTEEYWKTKEFLSWLYNESLVKDEVVVNDRFAKGMPGHHGDYYSSEYKDANLDYQHPWEESRGIGGSYGFNRAENLEDYSTSGELINELIDIVSRGGNLLLNVGPTADGRIPVIMQQRLKDIGDWLKVNGEAIYGTKPWKVEQTNSPFKYTSRDNSVYVFISDWVKPSFKINMSAGALVKNVSLLGSDVGVNWKILEKGQKELFVEFPDFKMNNIPCHYACTFKIELE